MCSIIPPISADLIVAEAWMWPSRRRRAVWAAPRTGRIGPRRPSAAPCRARRGRRRVPGNTWGNRWAFARKLWMVSAFQLEKLLENWGFDHQQIGGKCRGQLSTAFYSSHDSSIVSTDIYNIYIYIIYKFRCCFELPTALQRLGH